MEKGAAVHIYQIRLLTYINKYLKNTFLPALAQFLLTPFNYF